MVSALQREYGDDQHIPRRAHSILETLLERCAKFSESIFLSICKRDFEIYGARAGFTLALATTA